jgi:hypothetical protein
MKMEDLINVTFDETKSKISLIPGSWINIRDEAETFLSSEFVSNNSKVQI